MTEIEKNKGPYVIGIDLPGYSGLTRLVVVEGTLEAARVVHRAESRCQQMSEMLSWLTWQIERWPYAIVWADHDPVAAPILEAWRSSTGGRIRFVTVTRDYRERLVALMYRLAQSDTVDLGPSDDSEFQFARALAFDHLPSGIQPRMISGVGSTGLDDGPYLPGRASRKKPAPKTKSELKAIRAKAWATRRSALEGKEKMG